MLTWSGVKRDLNLVTVKPAVENTRSAGIDVTEIMRYLLAILEIRGKRCLFSFHHKSGDSSLSKGLSCT